MYDEKAVDLCLNSAFGLLALYPLVIASHMAGPVSGVSHCQFEKLSVPLGFDCALPVQGVNATVIASIANAANFFLGFNLIIIYLLLVSIRKHLYREVEHPAIAHCGDNIRNRDVLNLRW